METLGLVGLGLVGQALSARLLEAGYSVAGCDVDNAACDRARARGVDVVARADDLAGGCRTILLSLPDSAAVDAVLWGGRGLGPACAAGHTLLDTTTARPGDTEAHHRRLSQGGVRFIDVALVGSSREIGEGKGVALVGAREEDADFRPVVDAFAAAVYFFDAPGGGHRAKLVVNLVLGLNRLVLAEGLALAGKAGMDPGRVLEVLRNSGAYSRAMDVKGPRMIAGDFAPAARLAQHAKDVGLIRELAAGLGARVPVSDLHAALLDEAIAAGLGNADNSAVIELFR
ncbi:MAG: NAD(P)-dependent oxidoreductase [Candidatus Hydrogenedentes bacterium]|nr:NAD(P)-dependent oxidoreductase [Candidatus Hydrogenedentota bacterium]